MTQPLTRELARSLPHLRRYAHALTGSKKAGDRYLHACLEVAMWEPTYVGRTSDPKFALFKLFHDILRVTDCSARETYPTGNEPNEASEMQRRFKLLVALGGFSAERATQLVSTQTRKNAANGRADRLSYRLPESTSLGLPH